MLERFTAKTGTDTAAPYAIRLRAVRKEYKLYNSVGEQTLDVLGLSAIRFWRRSAIRHFSGA